METNTNDQWVPLHPDKLKEIGTLFSTTFPSGEYGDLAPKITEYWADMLEGVWNAKDDVTKQLDIDYDPSRPLSRIEQKTVVITYADSISKEGEPSLVTLDSFLRTFIPAIGGMHILPACGVAEGRFNDGYFSQIRRDRIHDAFGSNEQFAGLMRRYFSMADFVLNHVDIDNPKFQDYLDGDDAAGNCFFVFSEAEYQRRKDAGDFDQVFRPRPFPLFSIYRRRPTAPRFWEMSHDERVTAMAAALKEKTGAALPEAVINILYLFDKISNDQMLLETDYALQMEFLSFLDERSLPLDWFFRESETQEVDHRPYIFQPAIETREALLLALNYTPDMAGRIAAAFAAGDAEIFGEPVRALTTFSHVQVDLNTATYEGLCMLADDFSWYLGMDLNMLRLDAANYAFKRWGTSCFGLPEVKNLMKVLYLSMEAVSPRIVANLEVNDSLTTVLTQMADKEAPPPMMYDFHLASLLPTVFLLKDPSILARIEKKIAEYDIPRDSIRFSLAESHDGKSVRGSMDLLTKEERAALAALIDRQGGKIKYKAVPGGREPYELCTTTRDALPVLEDRLMEKERYLAFHTLAFALMGRNVKSIYFNDLLGLPNDYKRFETSGELRDVKRTKSIWKNIVAVLEDPESFTAGVAAGLNELIGLVDSDPALAPDASEARVLLPRGTKNPVAAVYNHRGADHSLTVINISDAPVETDIPLGGTGFAGFTRAEDAMSHTVVTASGTDSLRLNLHPFQRVWLRLTAPV